MLKEADLQSFPMSGYVNEYLGAIGNNMTAYMEGTMDMDTAVSNIQEEVQQLQTHLMASKTSWE